MATAIRIGQPPLPRGTLSREQSAIRSIRGKALEAKRQATQRTRAAQVDLQQSRSTARKQLRAQERGARSELEVSKQETLQSIRIQARQLMNLRDVPGLVGRIPKGGRITREAVTEMKKSVDAYLDDLGGAVAEANKEIGNWYQEQDKSIKSYLKDSQGRIDKWEKDAVVTYQKETAKAKERARKAAVAARKVAIAASVAANSKNISAVDKNIATLKARLPTVLSAEVYSRLAPAAASFYYRTATGEYVVDIASREIRYKALTALAANKLATTLPETFMPDADFAELMQTIEGTEPVAAKGEFTELAVPKKLTPEVALTPKQEKQAHQDRVDAYDKLLDYSAKNPTDIRLLYGTNWKTANEILEYEAKSPDVSTGGKALLRAVTPWKEEIGEKGTTAQWFQMYGELLFTPTRALREDITVKDISPTEWAVGVAQLALLAVPIGGLALRGIAKGALLGTKTYTGVSTAATMAFAADAAARWRDAGAVEKLISTGVTLAVALPVLGSIARLSRTGFIKALSPAGDIGFKGLAVFGKPVIGRTGGAVSGATKGKLIIGSKKIDIPSWTLQKAGWTPGPSMTGKIETSLYRSRKAMTKAGVPPAEQEKLIETLRLAKKAARKGKPSSTPKEVSVSDISSLTLGEKGAETVLRRVIQHKKKIQSIFGSGGTAVGLSDEAKAAWERMGRLIGDFDIRSSMTVAEAELWIRETAEELQKVAGKAFVKIDPENPLLILAKDRKTGEWHHYVDFKTKTATPGSPVAAEGAYGENFARSLVKVKIPGVGTVNLVRLDEQVLRKMASVLEWRSLSGFKELSVSQIVDIFKSGLSPEKQIASIRALLNPQTAKVFDAYLDIAEKLGGYRVSAGMLEDTFSFGIMKNNALTKTESDALLSWARRHVDDVKVGGSMADYHQLKGVKGRYTPGDADVTIIKGSKYTVDQAKADLEKILGKKVKKLVDVHKWDDYGTELVFGMQYQDDLILDGVRLSRVNNQLLDRISTTTTPGVKESLGLIGPEVTTPLPKQVAGGVEIGTHAGRAKDIERVNIIAKGMADDMAKTGKTATATELRSLIKTVEKSPRGDPVPAMLPDEAVVFGPQGHRLKDIVDEYAIFYTYHGQEVADDWLKLWDNLLKDTPTTAAGRTETVAALNKQIGAVDSEVNKLLSNRLAANKIGDKAALADIDSQLSALRTNRQYFSSRAKEVEAGSNSLLNSELRERLAVLGLSDKEITAMNLQDKLKIVSMSDPTTGRMGWEISLTDVAPSKGSPSVSTPVLPSLSPSLTRALKPSLYKTLTSPGSPKLPSISPSLGSPSVSPSVSPSPVSPKVSPSPTMASPRLRPSPSPGSPGPSLTPSPSPSLGSPSIVPTSTIVPPPPKIPPPGTKPRPRPIRLRKGVDGLSDQEKAGAAQWKQGFIWIIKYPPYQMENTIWTRKPVPGIKITDGPRSAYKTIQSFGGEVPEEIMHAMGVFKVKITKGKQLSFAKTRKANRAKNRARNRMPEIASMR